MISTDTWDLFFTVVVMPYSLLWLVMHGIIAFTEHFQHPAFLGTLGKKWKNWEIWLNKHNPAGSCLQAFMMLIGVFTIFVISNPVGLYIPVLLASFGGILLAIFGKQIQVGETKVK